MRRRWTLGSLLLFTGCVQVEPRGGLFEPVPGSDVKPASLGSGTGGGAEAPADPAPADGGFDFEADGRDSEDTPSEDDEEADLGRLAAGLGVDGDLSVSTPPEVTAPPPAAMPQQPAVNPLRPPTVQVWTPDTPLDGSFGVRLVSTVNDGVPPRAILGLPDGQEVVVKPGTMLPEQGVVVLAVGRDVVQVAEVVPSGDHARVQTQLLSSLYPGRAAEP